jgi:hypothetical protein
MLHYDGTTWTSMALGGTSDIWGVWGNGSKDVYALADVDGPWHWDGKSWQKMTFRSSNALDMASGTGDSDVYSLNWQATALYQYDGIDWAPVRLPTGSNVLYNLWIAKSVGYLTGGNGMILRLDRHCAAKETSCSNRWDDDCDGALNCADSDCMNDAYCNNGGTCRTLQTVTCGTNVSSSNAGGQPMLERYPCSPRLEEGREVYYRFTAPTTGNVTVNLSGLTADLDLIVLGAMPSGGCDPTGMCLGASATASSSEQVTFAATAGATYYIVVEGDSAADTSNFTLGVGCP